MSHAGLEAIDALPTLRQGSLALEDAGDLLD